MRGKGRYICHQQPKLRITPAYAGKSDRIAKLSYAMKGSPPPMRGKETGTSMKQQDQRITPAYAGKSR